MSRGRPRVAIDEGATATARTSATVACEKSSGNVFAGLGLPHPEQELPMASKVGCRRDFRSLPRADGT
mgnify:CR=1 FL=1